MKPPKILFILKKRSTSYGDGSTKVVLKSSGLLNSASFVQQNLVKNGINALITEVIDGNGIDKVVTETRPTHVIIEAVWVTPEKFEVLQRLHPTVKWIVRVHSETPFLSGEGIAIRWIMEYVKMKNVIVSFNSRRTNDEFQKLVALSNPTFCEQTVASKVVYLPNFYPVGNENMPYVLDETKTLNVGCFGAIRPLKNQCIQAIAAIKFAEKHGYKLNFHINGTRVEGGGDNNIKNIRSLFAALPADRFALIEHGWMTHREFIAVIKTMDIGMQVSFTETFNIVTADFVNVGVPMVVSSEVEFMPWMFKAHTTSSDDIVRKMEWALRYKKYLHRFYDVNRAGLRRTGDYSTKIWLAAFGVKC